MGAFTVRAIQRVFGLILVVFGLNGFFHFLPLPEKEGFAFVFLQVLQQAKYIFPIVAAIMTCTGILMILNRAVAFALLMQLPVSFNIFAFHLFHDGQGIVAALAIFGMNNFLILSRIRQYKVLFSNKQEA